MNVIQAERAAGPLKLLYDDVAAKMGTT